MAKDEQEPLATRDDTEAPPSQPNNNDIRRLWSVGADYSVRVWDSTTQELVNLGHLPGALPLISIAFDPGGALWGITKENAIVKWNPEEVTWSSPTTPAGRGLLSIAFDLDGVPHGVRVDGTIVKWDGSDNEWKPKFRGADDRKAVHVTFDPHGHLWAALQLDHAVAMYDEGARKWVTGWGGPGQSCIAFDTDAALWGVGDTCNLSKYDWDTRRWDERKGVGAGALRTIAFDPDRGGSPGGYRSIAVTPRGFAEPSVSVDPGDIVFFQGSAETGDVTIGLRSDIFNKTLVRLSGIDGFSASVRIRRDVARGSCFSLAYNLPSPPVEPLAQPLNGTVKIKSGGGDWEDPPGPRPWGPPKGHASSGE